MAAKKKETKKSNTTASNTEPNTTKPVKKSRAKKAAKKTTLQPTTSVRTIQQAGRGFPIVAIGASAGGLEAFETFFKAMPLDSGMAFVLIAHLDPTHASILADILQKSTKMRVLQVEDGVEVLPNTVHVIPPNKTLSILNGILLLNSLLLPRAENLPINIFFRSLAQDQGANAIGIILSGNGTDGTLGLKAIKDELGMVMVQSIESAKFDGMPQSAIATNLIDYVLPPEKMPKQLIQYATTDKRSPFSTIADIGTGPIALQKIFELLRTRTGHDFSHYKKNTICRRIERRMHIHKIDDILAYVRYLQEEQTEVDALFQELLIGVTHFFRDAEAFEILKKDILPKLLVGKPKNYTFRVWIPGCSTGEEPYSIAILLKECMEDLQCHVNLQIFGTDIDRRAIGKARAGVYPNSIAGDISPERLKRYFDKEEDHYRIKKSVREVLIFAPQNVIKDPPFTKIDLICCRNLLIYLNLELQQKLLPLFHYSLKTDGILFLGSSETIGQTTDLFERIDQKWKIYRHLPRTLSTRRSLSFPPVKMEDDMPNSKDDETIRHAEELSVLQLAQTILEESNVSPSVIIDNAFNIVYIHGRTGKYLEPAPGKASANLLEMARPGLRSELSTAIAELRSKDAPVIRKNIAVDTNGNQVVTDLVIRPILKHTDKRGFIMVTFETPVMIQKSQQTSSAKKPASTQDINLELRHTRESLHITVEELETSNEELKSTNEELQSTNEELQSTNEELETSKEEMQSLNEESETVNTELQSRIQELSTAHDDMKNLLDSTQIATLFLNTDLGIHRFTPRITELIPLSNTDIDRSIAHFSHNLIDVDFAACANQVLADLAVIVREVENKNNQFFIMRVRPYRTIKNVIEGVVITFDNITERKLIEEQLRLSEVHTRAALKMLSSSTTVAQVDKDLRYIWVYNPHPDFVVKDILGKRDDELATNAGTLQLLELKRRVLKSGIVETEEITFPISGKEQIYKITAEPIRDATQEIIGVITATVDITDLQVSKNRSESPKK